MSTKVVKPPAPRASRVGGRYSRKKTFTPIPPDPPAQQPVSDTTTRQPKCCDKPTYETHDGAKICVNCGTQISEQNIVAEVTFGETSTGAAKVQGGRIGEGARHANTLGPAASRRIGGENQSRDETDQNGRSELRQMCPALRIPPQTEEVAFNIWKLAAANNFIQGRRSADVAGVCLYAACRREKQNTTLLMDIAESLSVSVFRLGDIYKELCKKLYLEVHRPTQAVAEVEPLLMKYCSKLEFGEKTALVAEDAARIVKRMKRDWMVTGRNPAGLCGACILLASRMNNFRRTVREIVYVVKVSEITIGTRLAEFKKTHSSGMSVEDFRSKSHRLIRQHDPPSITAAADRAQKIKATMERRAAREEARSREASLLSVGSRQSSAAPSDTSATTDHNSPRRDADGFAIPALPDSEGPPKKRARTKAHEPPVILTEEDFALENELEHDIEDILQDQDCISAKESAENDEKRKHANALADEHRTLSAANAAARIAAHARATTTPLTAAILDSPEIGDWEFADDPEVQNAVLPEEMVQIKETIWLRDNEDWLRAQQAKHLKAELERAAGGPGERKRKTRKRGRMGDGTVLTESGTPVLSPADAAQRMLDKRAGKGISKAIDYTMLNKVFGGDVGPSEAERKRLQRAGSVMSNINVAVEEDEDEERESWAGDSPGPEEEDEEDFARATEDMTGDFGYDDD